MAFFDGTDGGFFDQLQTPGNYGLLAAGLGILANARGPNSQNAIGAGALTGLQAAQSAQQSQGLQEYRQAQIKKLQGEARKQEELAGLFSGASSPRGPLLASAGGSMPSGSMPSSGGLLNNLTLDQVARIKTLGGGDLLPEWTLAHYGKDRAPGSFNVGADGRVTFTPSVDKGQEPIFNDAGQVVGVRAIPGAAQAAAEMAGATTAAQEGAKTDISNENTIVHAPDGKGGTIDMTQAEYLKRLKGAQEQPNLVASSGSAALGLGQTLSPQVTAARAELPKVDTQVTQMIGTIDKALNHPGLSHSVGVWSMVPALPGTDRADFRAVQDQLQGQAFLQAYQSLRGGGQITEIEGSKAENAIARLGSAQSEPAYREALSDLRSVLTAARDRAYKQAGLSVPDASGIFSPKSAADFESLPSGALFKAPDGTLRRKP